ncbi:MAG: hypothetical protein IPM64_05020 [Phycisphaerales bacterium]|nr:hypothetical protein [Phycisphaerales bacterium]
MTPDAELLRLLACPESACRGPLEPVEAPQQGVRCTLCGREYSGSAGWLDLVSAEPPAGVGPMDQSV